MTTTRTMATHVLPVLVLAAVLACGVKAPPRPPVKEPPPAAAAPNSHQ